MIKKRLLNFLRSRLVFQTGEEFLEGYCGISSYCVARFLKEEYGIASDICFNVNHCFLTVGDKTLDLTASQFDNRIPRVYFANKALSQDNGYGCPIHRVEARISYPPDISEEIERVYLKPLFQCWPPFQNPFKQKRLVNSILSDFSSYVDNQTP